LNPWNFLKTREQTPELMDLPSCDGALLKKTVEQFKLLNRLFTASRKLISRYIFCEMMGDTSRVYTMLDIGAGGCDIDLWVAEEARRRGLTLRITALDHDDRIIAMAREATRDFPEITIVNGDLNDLPQFGDFDFIFCNHLLHHLNWGEIGPLLRHIERQTKICYLLNDLRRSVSAYIGYAVFTSLFLAPSLARVDGLLSIRKGFSKEEWKAFLKEQMAGTPVKILRVFPARLALYRRKI
jgi:2-polyprenyl-3-methyl-5-hydroxy-6-metoxy-1,4-benzoquinol methylase